ncbi:MAG: hypothetical protein Q8L27_00385 [archaeon]|nr:hypothetical protein [archaeon]
MLETIFNKTLDYLSAGDISRETQTIINSFEEKFPADENSIDYERESHLDRLRFFKSGYNLTLAHLPNFLDAIEIGQAVAENRVPYGVLAVEAFRIAARISTKHFLKKEKQEINLA